MLGAKLWQGLRLLPPLRTIQPFCYLYHSRVPPSTAMRRGRGPNSQGAGRGGGGSNPQGEGRGGGYGRGGRGGGRGGGGGGRGEQRWWDPAWRAEKLKQMQKEGPAEEKLDENEWWQKLQNLKIQSNEQEIIIRRNFGRLGADVLQQMADEASLYFHSYNKGRNTVMVVSKVPLPDYRADLDEVHGTRERELKMSTHVENRIENVLANLQNNPSASSSSSSTANMGNPVEKPLSGLNQLSIQEASPNVTVDKDKISSELRERQRRLQASPAVKSMRYFREKLPAFTVKEKILQAVATNQVLVISGETGCGKTTQLPQFILEENIEAGRGADCSIICTQPRRISAISVATRVASERGERIGESVGYQIRLESKRSSQTQLLFCTTGVLLRKLVQDPKLTGVSHVLVDEIHERGLNEDFLLIILRDLLSQRPDLRIVLMSATINAEMFASYFHNAPVVHIPGITFPVEEFFLEHTLEKARYAIGYNNSSQSRSRFQDKKKDPVVEIFERVDIDVEYRAFSKETRQSLQLWNADQLDLGLVEATLEYICKNEGDGSILVFLTGWDDISKLLDNLKVNSFLGDSRRFLLVPLHGSMPTVNQQEIFQRPPSGVRKIVLATNIAETSITIDDIVYVVDCGKAKETSYDALNKRACLLPMWISKASARQRKGRAGRVQAGVCYHLYPRVMFEAMSPYQLPEILRTPLQELCLQIKSLQLGKIADFLSKALQPPEELAVKNAVDLLWTIGALDKDEQLTALGRHLSTLPVDPQVGKMLLMGAMFQCLGPALTIAAALAHRDPFVLPIERKEEADEARRWFAGGSCSDHIALLRAFEGWQAAKREGRERKFCWENFLSSPTLHMMEDMRLQFINLLSDIGFVNNSSNLQEFNKYSSDVETIQAVVCAGLYPSVAQSKRRGKRSAFFTKEDGKVEPHPSSVIARVHDFPYPWFVYSDKVQTSGIYLRDSTNIPDYVLLMFGGALVPSDDGTVKMLDGYLQFSAPKKIVQLVQGLRGELDSLLRKKIEQPKLDIRVEGKEVVSAVIELLHSGTGSSSRRN